MPQPKRGANFGEHRLVKNLVPDTRSRRTSRNTRRLTGFVGKSDQSGQLRLYLTSRLDDYVEVPTDEVVGVEELPETDETPFGGNVVYVNDDAAITRTHDIDLQQIGWQAQVQFLRGDLRPPSGPLPDPAPDDLGSVGLSSKYFGDTRGLLLGGSIKGGAARTVASDGITGVFCSATVTIALEC
jgi:hypothetical protein